MSLNGLDDPTVTAAYQSALTEAGGWFLLRYVSRDEVEVHKNGKGGLVEARSAVAEYEKKSPLYGFLLYRRRKVLIKYIPDGTSRLLQARVTVHFQSITEKFYPHDTIFSISAPEDLNDITLTAACALHTASATASPTSPATTSSRKKLSGITEDVAEELEARPIESIPPVPQVPETPAPKVELPVVSETPIDTKEEEASEARPQTPVQAPPTEQSEVLETKVSEDSTPSSPKGKENVGSSFNANFSPDSTEFPRSSSSTLRPYPEDLASFSSYAFKPKVKLGPRPRTSIDSNKRPKTAGSSSVATLPAGLKVPRRNAGNVRPRSRDSGAPPTAPLPPTPPISATPDRSSILTATSPQSGRAPSVKSLPAIAHRAPPRSPGLSLEKRRLMKAVELRKKQMKAQEEREAAEVAAATEDADSGAVQEERQEQDNPVILEDRPQVQGLLGSLEAETLAEEEEPSQIPTADANQPEERNDVHQQKTEMVDSAVDTTTSLDVPGDKTPLQNGVNGSLHHPPEADEEQSSLIAASSPTSVQESSVADLSTRPSSIAEEDLLPSTVYVPPPPKSAGRIIIQESDDVPDSDNANSIRESVDSTPTVVPEDRSPVPSERLVLEEGSSESGQFPVQPHLPTFRKTEYTPSKDHADSFVARSDASISPAITPQRSSHDLRINTDFKRKEKRRGMLSPTHINTSAENSDIEYLSDDDLMDELESATVQHARPLTVSKSPITPFFPNARKGSATTITLAGRPGTAGTNDGLRRTGSGVGVLEMARSFSGSSANQTEAIAAPKKTGVSSGISKRIKALAEKSTRDSAAGASSAPARPDSPAGEQEWRRNLRTPPKGLSAAHTKWHQRESVASMESVAQRELYAPKSQFIQPSAEDLHATVYNVRQEGARPESVSVTARIIRDDRSKNPDRTAPTEHTPLELHQSPLIIDHQRANPVPVLVFPPESSKLSLRPASPTEANVPSPVSTDASRESANMALPRTSSESNWRNFGRRKSDAKSPPPLDRNLSASSLGDEDESRDKDKKKSRTSRLMKRMSNTLTGSNRKTLAQVISPPATEAPQSHRDLGPLREPPPAMRIGDVNIQFPDTLLWKRRYMEIDSQGNLVLTISQTNDNSRGVTKRYHLTEFRTPYAPDLDRQELPNSVVLDFLEGSTLQCACESYMAQAQVLQILKEAHHAWLTFTQQ